MDGSSRSAGPGAVTSLPQSLLWLKVLQQQLKREVFGISSDTLAQWVAGSTLGEFAGTFLFLFFAYAGAMVGKSSLGGTPSTTSEFLVFLLFGATSFGASLAINVWILFRVSGGLFNPAVITAAFMLCSLTHPIRGVFIIITQLIAGICAAAVVDALTPGPLSVDNALGPNVSVSQDLLMDVPHGGTDPCNLHARGGETSRHIPCPFGIGIALFMGHMVGIYYTGAGLNPARSLGPAVVEKTFPGYHRIYWIGPFLGSLLASFFYKTLRVFEYYTANEGQDDDGRSHKLA